MNYPTCKYCKTRINDGEQCNDCWEMSSRIKRDPKKALTIIQKIQTEEQGTQFGNKIIEILGLKVKKNGRVDTSGGDKTPLGLARTLLRYLEDSL